MDKLKINLIPPEIKEKAKKEAKRSLVIRISIGLLGLLILATSGILAVIIFQNVTLQSLNASLEEEKGKVAKLKDKEAVVFFLKNRLDSINKFSATRYTQSDVFELITSLYPVGVDVLSLKIDRTEKVQLQGKTDSTASLDSLFNNLTDPKINEGKIASVSVESLNRGQDGSIKFSLIINMGKK